MKLKDITYRITKGTTPNSSSFGKNEVTYIKSESLSYDGIIDKSKFTSIDEETHNTKLKRSILKENDILYSIAGMNLGKVGIVDKNYLPANTNQAVALITVNDEIIKPRYLYYYLQQNKIIKSVNFGVSQSAQPNLNLAQIGEFDIDVPGIDIQQKIVNILDSITNKIILNNEMNESLLELNKNIYQEQIDKIKNGCSDDNYKKLNEIVEINSRGLSPDYTDSGIPVINQSCVRNGIIKEEKIQYHDISKNVKDDYYYKPYDLLINSMGVGTLGRMAQLGDLKKKYLIHSCVSIIRAKEDIISQFILGQELMSKQDLIENMAQGSTGQTSLSNKDLGNIKIFVPPKYIQDDLKVLLKSNVDKITNNLLENDELCNLKDILLSRLMNGEIINKL